MENYVVQRFSMDRRDISDNLTHLTNVAVQREGTRHAEDGVGSGAGAGSGAQVRSSGTSAASVSKWARGTVPTP